MDPGTHPASSTFYAAWVLYKGKYWTYLHILNRTFQKHLVLTGTFRRQLKYKILRKLPETPERRMKISTLMLLHVTRLKAEMVVGFHLITRGAIENNNDRLLGLKKKTRAQQYSYVWRYSYCRCCLKRQRRACATNPLPVSSQRLPTHGGTTTVGKSAESSSQINSAIIISILLYCKEFRPDHLYLN